ncbi:MAG: TonB-dependent receptor [Bacteroidota bacterium]
MKTLFTLGLFLLFVLPQVAQSDISGRVTDSTSTSLPGANVVLLRASDSLLVSFATTDNRGDFLLENVPVGTHQMTISFLGYERSPQTIVVTENDQYLGLGDLVMYPAGYLLGNVEVTADRIPIRMVGDTMMYDAEAFAVGQNANVEDLLRRLPGMSIDASGAITWRGQTVNQVLVNGRPFFAGNSSLITQNLDAEAISNVEVFDQQTNTEELSGIDDGEENTTINLEMKEEFKAKVFGDLEAGYGNNDRYRGGAKLFRISEVSQFGLLGTINNINQVGFSIDDVVGLNRNTGRGASFSSGNTGEIPINWSGEDASGQNRSIAAGLNYGTTFGEAEVQLSYALFDRNQAQIQSILEAINRPGSIRETSTNQLNASDSYSHRLDFNVEQDLDSLSRLDIRGAVFILGNEATEFSEVTISDPGQDQQFYTVDDRDQSEQPGGNVSVDYSRRLGKPGRLLGVEALFDLRQNVNDIGVTTDGLSEELAIPGALINGLQTQDRTTDELDYNGSLEYTEPIGDNWSWESEIRYASQRSEGDFIFETEGQSVRNQLTRTWETADVETGFSYRFGKRNSIKFTGRLLNGQLGLEGDTERDDNFTYFLPGVRMRIRGDKSNIRFSFRSSASAPRLNSLQTIAEPGRSGRVSFGNPDLTPSVRYSSNINYWFNDQFRSITFFSRLSATYTDNAIGNELSFSQGQQIFRPINVSHAWNQSFSLGTNIGILPIKSQFSVRGSLSRSQGIGIVDNERQDNISLTQNIESSINTEINDNSFVTLGYEWSRNVNRFEDEETEEITTVTHDLFTKFGLEFSKVFRFESTFTYRIFEAAAFTGATNIPDLRASVEWRPFKSGHFFRLNAFDLFNQNTIINRSVNAFVTRETTSDALGRFFLLTFFYKL